MDKELVDWVIGNRNQLVLNIPRSPIPLIPNSLLLITLGSPLSTLG
jgi:hypothetical protein